MLDGTAWQENVVANTNLLKGRKTPWKLTPPKKVGNKVLETNAIFLQWNFPQNKQQVDRVFLQMDFLLLHILFS